MLNQPLPGNWLTADVCEALAFAKSSQHTVLENLIKDMTQTKIKLSLAGMTHVAFNTFFWKQFHQKFSILRLYKQLPAPL